MTEPVFPAPECQPCCGEFLTCQRPCTPRGTNEAMQRAERMLRVSSTSLPPEFAKVIQDNFWALVQGHPESAIAPVSETRPTYPGLWNDAALGQACEGMIALKTHFTGEPPYVGNEGVLLALREALDELNRLKALPSAIAPRETDPYKRNPEKGRCKCGLKEVPAGCDGVQWYWQRHARYACTLELPNLKCWCGRLRSEHIDGHDETAPRPHASADGGNHE